MSTTLLQCVAECFQGSGRLEGMHCLGAVASADAASPSGVGSRGGVMSVVRALGVLVCEGRIQGPPRGYKEGPHCAAPLQAPPNDHMCEKDNYLCGRYLVLVREIADRITTGSSLCVEVLMCSDCPCGLARATCKDPISLISSTAISQWQHPSDILLEYWSICVVPSKSPEMMNSQGLYQAVRSRLHFSQVAAWWSRSNGKRPNYVTTRIVPYNEDNLRKFRESPIEHTFPLAGIGDGNSIKVTVWALPRMEEVPTLSCSVHTIKDKDEECVARALTPTKNGPVPSSSQSPETLVLPVLVDDRLQTPCDKPGKHHCHCEDEDGCPPSPSIRPNGERKRRRSLPCGPPESGAQFAAAPLPSVQETIFADPREASQSPNYSRYVENQNYPGRNYRTDEQSLRFDATSGFDNRSYLSTGSLERSFRTQVSLEEQEGNEEKRYKPSTESSDNDASIRTNVDENSLMTVIMPNATNDWNRSAQNDGNTFDKIDNSQFVATDSPTSWPFEAFRNVARPGVARETNVVVNPFAESSSYRETNPGPSSYGLHIRENLSPISPPCTVHQNYSRSPRLASASVGKSSTNKFVGDDSTKNCFAPGKDLSQLMSKLAFPKEKTSGRSREEGGILDWFSKVPGRVMAVPANDEKSQDSSKVTQEPKSNEVKFKNCNLELSQREFNEVLAVLRARTPSGRRRTPVKTIRRRDRSEKLVEDSSTASSSTSSSDKSGRNSIYGADNCVCPIHRQVQRSAEHCVCKFCRKTNNQPPHKSINGNSVDSFNGQCVYRCQAKLTGPKSSRDDWPETATNGVAKNCNSKSTDCLQNVSNKADVLLGAILRTSRERKGLTDISNGTRPRTVATTERSEDPVDYRPTTASTGARIVPFEDDKSLPSVLNKRLHRFKQLFKKEWDRRDASATEVSSPEVFSNLSRKDRDDGESNEQTRESRIKRKIDFTNFYVGMGKSDHSYVRLIDGGISETHQNSQFHSTNSKREDSNNQRSYEPECTAVSSCECPRVSGDESSIGKSIATPIALQNGQASLARSRNKNEPISIDIDEDETIEKGVPSAIEQEQFRRSLENAASMVFHSRTGLPLTSSPAPLRRGSCCFDYDSSLNTVSSKRSALFKLNTPPSPGAVSLEETDREIENSGEGEETPKRTSTSRSRPQSHALLGSFEESALNGRLEPVSTVHGFTAELGASGSFCPKHRKLPVTVFFYTLGDNDKVSTPYLAHINLGKKGYQVPRSGTIQVTLLNPLGTVVKMFVVLYDLSDMPPRSHTFLRQRTLRDKTLRYLVHLRFMSGKSGRIYLHTDIRMIICRKSDVDTASDFGSEPPKELRSYIHGPTNPKFSPRC